MAKRPSKSRRQIIPQARPPVDTLPLWGERLVFHNFIVELVPPGERHFNVRLTETFASINFAPAEGTSSLAGDRVRRYERRPYEFIVAPPMFPLKGETAQAPEVLAFVIKFDAMRNIISGGLGEPAEAINPEVILGSPTPFTTALAKKIRAQISNANASAPYVEALATTLIVELFRPMVARKKQVRTRMSPDLINMLLSYIDANLEGDLGIDKLAQLVGVSNDHLIRAFKRTVGEPPHTYVISRRTDTARNLLEETDHSLSQIAYATGFSSQSHMTTAFRKMLGTTPGAIRRAT